MSFYLIKETIKISNKYAYKPLHLFFSTLLKKFTAMLLSTVFILGLILINFFDNSNIKYFMDNLDNLFFKNHQFNSNLISTNDLNDGFYRLLATDNNVVLPYQSWIRFLITSVDVLHSWAVPSLGIKLDACPGRLNQTSVFMKREGFFYGQCSEICGTNHAFMPITVEAVDMESFYYWSKAPFSSFMPELDYDSYVTDLFAFEEAAVIDKNKYNV